MRQYLVLAALVGFCSCGRLESQYLPPKGASNQYSNQNNFNQQGNYNQGGFNKEQYNGPINKAANEVPILKLDNNNDGETYNYALETGDGTSIQEHGDARGDGTNSEGGFEYTAPDGERIQIQYTAGENGFIPIGHHIPTAPPVPEDIQKAVEQNLADEANGIYDDGQYKEDASNSGQYQHEGGYGGNNGNSGNSGNYGGYRQQASASQNKFSFQGQSQNQYVPPSSSNQGQGGYKY